ncbi:ECF RNA polymerase sigma factor SigK [Frankia sp. AgKG'84/4]|uniref:ECF RNA polymerase sigma factor SigK n=1 Tax=Frankia sp. AgKG'84/4 TaxID=573490 RepID=UPI00200BAFC1|nr:ECF RNA polymerase sigma factor SigK [Frankia sp. AgKG'84/4]MCL9795826.1 ECF RNA polymerase sigma factor SigK [Frankia sp. AgKG'84/4]
MHRRADDDDGRVLRAVGDHDPTLAAGNGTSSVDSALLRAGRGDTRAFSVVYDQLATRVYGLVRRVVRDPAQAEEVTQEVFVEVWRQANRFDPARGNATGWICTLAHRRAVDRVRSAQAATDRERRAGDLDARGAETGYDEVVEQVELRMEYERLRRCLHGLTDLQRESISLAYYSGYTYREVAEMLSTPVPTVKTRMRDGLIRLRDCLGVTA